MAAATATDDALGWAGTIRGKIRVNRAIAVDAPCLVYEATGDDGRALRLEAAPLSSLPDDDRRSAILDSLRAARRVSEADGAFVPIVGLGVEIDRERAAAWLAWPVAEVAQEEKPVLRDAPTTLLEAVQRLSPIARALDVAHERGLVHGSIDAPHVAGGRVRGFGRATLFDVARAPVRTEARFAAPEQIDGALGPIGPWTDVFALAALFVEIVVGRAPLSGSASTYVDRLMDRARRPTPRTLGVGVSPTIDAVLACALAVDPRARPSRASAFWGPLVDAAHAAPSTFDLVGATTKKTTSTAPPSPPPPKTPRRTSELERCAIGGAILVGIGIFAVESAIRARTRSSPPSSPSPSSSTIASSAPSSSIVVASIAPSTSASSEAPVAPDRLVSIDDGGPPLLVDRTEVTVADYRRCIAAGACTPTRETSIAYDESDPYRKNFVCNAFVDGRDDHPINCVTFKQASAYCEWAGERLPTAEEWTRAAGGEHARFPWGREPPSCDRVVFARYGKEQWGCREDPVGTAPAGSHPQTASAFGVLDLGGNVWEWTTERGDGGTAVLRGGGWDSSEKMLEVSARLEQAIYNGEVNVGVRCVR